MAARRRSAGVMGTGDTIVRVRMGEHCVEFDDLFHSSGEGIRGRSRGISLICHEIGIQGPGLSGRVTFGALQPL